jgi:deoxyhypusine synthase
VIELMDRGLIDFMISTGANLYHDLHYALNFTLRRGSPFVDDVALYEDGVIRIYDVLFPATVLLETDQYIRDFIVRSGLNEPIATSEFHYRLGLDLLERYPGCEEHSVVARAALAAVPLYTSSPGDSSIGMNIAYHELMNDSRLMIDPNRDVNEVCAIVLAGTRNGCVILGGGSPKNFYLQAQPTLWEVYGIPKGGNDYFIQITTDQVVWGGLSGATPAEAVSWGKVNPSVLPDTVVAYCDSTIAFPIFCEYAVGSANGRRQRKELVHKRDQLVADLAREAKAAREKRMSDVPASTLDSRQ